MSIAENRREMFSPYGRGSGHEDRQPAGSTTRKRSGSAPPALSRKSLSEFVGGESERSSQDPYKTPVPTAKGEDSSRYVAPAPAPTVSLAPTQVQSRPVERAPPADVRDVSAAVSRWANKSLAELMAGKGFSASNQPAATVPE